MEIYQLQNRLDNLPISSAVVTLVLAAFALAVEEATIAVGIFLVGVIISAGMSMWLSGKVPRQRKADVQQRYQPEVMWAVLPLAAETRAEKVYGDILLLMLDEKAADEETLRDLLRQLNALLESSRTLTEQRQRVETAIGPKSVVELEKERDEVARRLDRTIDAMARQAL